MTTVYRTYLDASELLPPLAYFFLFMARRLRRGLRGAGALLAGIGWPDAAPPAARHVIALSGARRTRAQKARLEPTSRSEKLATKWAIASPSSAPRATWAGKC